MPGPETRLVARIRRAVLDAYPDAWVLKVHGSPYQPAGIPDLLVVVRGRLVGIEVKAQRAGESREHALGRVTAVQQAALAALRRAGATGGVALSPGEALALIASGLGSDPSR